MRTLTILICCLLIVPSLLAQQGQSEYLEAKRQFGLENYKVAKDGFGDLANDPTFGAYASFYYGLSAYRLEEWQQASEMWKQVKAKYPDWNQGEEVNFWLATVAFRLNKYSDAIKYASLLPAETSIRLIHSFMKDLDYNSLKKLHEENPENEQIALYLAKEIVGQPFDVRDTKLLNNLTEKFNINIQSELSDLPLVKKDNYSVALVLPFMFESLDQPQSVIRNHIIFDLYQGMELAREDLEKENIKLSLYPFDTQKQKQRTQQIVNSGALNNADVIIGPLYGGPNEVIKSFSIDKKVPCINPLSSNGSVVAGNPNAFLFKPSYVTQGKAAADYAIKKFQRNKNAFVFFETNRDEAVATAYKEMIEEAGFNVVKFDQLTTEDALQLQIDFTEQHEVYYDKLTRSEIDSIRALPNRYVRTRPARDRNGKIRYHEDGRQVLRYYEMRFNIREDSIGHIFAATSSNLLANNMISMVDVRGDSIGLIGYEDWLDFELTSYNQLERLEIALINTSYFKEDAASSFRLKVREKYHILPSKYHKLGYELIMQLGQLLKDNGKHFQRGLLSGARKEGFLMEGIQYGPYNNNQVVPIVTIEDYNLKVRNNQNEDR